MQILAIRRNNYLLDNSSLLFAHWSRFLFALRQSSLDRQFQLCDNRTSQEWALDVSLKTTCTKVFFYLMCI